MPATGTYQDRRPHELQRHWIRVSKPYKQHAVAASRPPSRHSPPGARLSPSPARAPLGLGVLQPCRMAARPVAAAPSAGSARRSTSISQHSMGSRLQVPGMRTPMAPSAPPPGGRGGRRQAAVMGTAAASPTRMVSMKACSSACRRAIAWSTLSRLRSPAAGVAAAASFPAPDSLSPAASFTGCARRRRLLRRPIVRKASLRMSCVALVRMLRS
mmetsp:Transcript_31924/g.81744  ORF Transcript_31924/g.81744 Transcript_31924/m.81744 type:complete len:214 (-) Transcript_31924:824-1465(-)